MSMPGKAGVAMTSDRIRLISAEIMRYGFFGSTLAAVVFSTNNRAS